MLVDNSEVLKYPAEPLKPGSLIVIDSPIIMAISGVNEISKGATSLALEQPVSVVAVA